MPIQGTSNLLQLLSCIILLTMVAVNSMVLLPQWKWDGFGGISIKQSMSPPLTLITKMVSSNQQLQQACTQNNTHIKFNAQLTTLKLSWNIRINGVHNVIIQGPITLSDYGLYIDKNATNIIIYNIRVLNAAIYGILIKQSHNVVIDHVTVVDASRASVDVGKNVDITEDSSNITISNCIIGYILTQQQKMVKYKGMLIANFKQAEVTNVSLHHNLFYCNYQRSPQISTPGLFDYKNNIVYNYTEYGTRVRNGAYGNFIANYYIGGKKDPLVFITNQLQSQNIQHIRSLSNYWLSAKLPQSWIQLEQIGSQQVVTPYIHPESFQDLLNKLPQLGCLDKSGLQQQIVNNVVADAIPVLIADYEQQQ